MLMFLKLSRSSIQKLLFFISLFLIHQQNFAQSIITKEIVQPVKKVVVNMQQLSDMAMLLPPGTPKMGFIPNKIKIPFVEEYSDPVPSSQPISNTANRITVASPSSVLNYEGITDEAQVGSGFYNIPPDTYGAIGLDKVFTQLNNNYRVLNKTTGAQISKVSIETFWNALGVDGDNVFDPRVTYDPYNNRWLVAAVSHGDDAASRFLLGISQTHDPSGNYNLYSFDPDPGTANWADYPMLGFNKNWVAIGINMFVIGGGGTTNRFYVIDYPALRNGIVTATVFTGTSFCTHPAETYSASEESLFAPNHIGSGAATYRLNSITGTPASPVFNVGALQVRTGGGWVAPGGNLGPQNCISGTFTCPGVLTGLDVGDSFIRSNVVFRNNAIWYAQTVGLPTSPITRTAAQWTKLNTNGTFADGGRIEDPAATSANGSWFTYPSIAVNNNNDVVVGFSKLDGTDYASAGYAFRYGTDAAGTMQDPVVYKAGEDYYEKTFGGSRNRWGDYSHTMVDPLDDASFWTIQEYAKPRTTPSIGGSNARWGTWWAKVAPDPCLSNVTSGNWNNSATWGCGSVPNATKHVNIISGQNVTLDINPSAASITINEGGTLTVNASRTLSCKLIVYGTLNITGGKLTLGANDVFLARGATLTGANSSSYFITNGNGRVSKMIGGGSSFEFPVSANGTTYNGLNVALNAGDPEEVFSVRVESGVNPASGSASNCVQRTWNISEMKTGGNNAVLTFKWVATDHGGGFNVSIPPYAFRHNGAAYGLASTMSLPSLSVGVYSSSTSGAITNFSPWIISSTSTLPITLNYFTGTKISNDKHLLDWKATCSGASASFDIERSADGRNFNSLNSVTGDFIRCQQPFDFTDVSPLSGKNFYRIKMIDENGKITYSHVILLLNSKVGFEIVNLQPNPVIASATLNISLAQKQTLKLFITDAKGSRIFQKDIIGQSGVHQEQINTSTFASGVYTVVLISEMGEQKTIRFIKQ